MPHHLQTASSLSYTHFLAVADGDTVTVYVSTTDPRESSRVPQEVQIAAVERNETRARRNYTIADALHKQITDDGYRWWGIDINISLDDMLSRFDGRLLEKYMPFIASMMACFWVVWSNRNKVVHEAADFTAGIVFEHVQQQAFYWIKHRWKSKALLSWDI